MFTLGCHLSYAGGYMSMAESAVTVGADTFQFFTRSPRGSRAKSINPVDIAAFEDYAAKQGIRLIMGYAPYTINPASDVRSTRDFALMALSEDLARMERTPHQLYAIHPGNAVGQTLDEGISLVAQALDHVMSPSQTTTVLLVTMSGEGSEVGTTFEQLATIMKNVREKDRLGVCFDACEAWGAGYDIVNDLDGVLAKFDDAIGLDKLRAVHLNDSEYACGSRKDRHARIGEGHIGFDALVALTKHPALGGVPFYLEEPKPTLSLYAEDIRRFRAAQGADGLKQG